MEIIFRIILITAVAVTAAGGLTIFKIVSTCRRNNKALLPAEQIYEGRDQRYALIVYQPSPHGTVDGMARRAAEVLHKYGYTVVLNHPSEELPYQMDHFRVVIYGSAVFLERGSDALLKYIKTHPFSGKKVLLFTVGKDMDNKKAMEPMEAAVHEGNFLCRVKVQKGQEDVIEDLVCRHFL